MTKENCLNNNQKLWLISYGSGAKVHGMNQKLLALSAIYKGFDVIINYKRDHIEKDFLEKHARILNQPRGNGYWLWKPYFINHTLKMMNDNDILLYSDSGAFLKKKIDSIVCKAVNEAPVQVFSLSHKHDKYTKIDAIKLMGYDHEIVYPKYQIYASFMFLRKTNEVVDFVKKWAQCVNILANHYRLIKY